MTSKSSTLLGYPWMTKFTLIPARTTGVTGHLDAGDPNMTTLLGDTGGPLGYRDHGDPARFSFARDLSPSFTTGSPALAGGLALSLGSQDPSGTTKVLTYPGTTYRYQRTTRTLASCLDTLPAGLREPFAQEIRDIITGMHELGFALGVSDKALAGYRTFDEQNGLGREATRAGPGESFHNYLCAVDLGFLQWVDEDGKARSDFWLGQMDALPKYKGLSALLWAKRNSFSDAVHALSWEIIHLQNVPADTSCRDLLVQCLNQAAVQAGDGSWLYRRHGRTEYACTLGTPNQWTVVGTAKQLWEQASPERTAAEKQKMRQHMVGAETIAKTIDVG